MRRIFLLLNLFLLSMLCACNGSDASSETPPISYTLVLVEEGQCPYTIVRGDKADAVEIDAAIRLKRAVDAETGAGIGIGNDWVKTEADIPTDTLEILIGETNRAESRTGDDLTDDDYVIAVVGKRVVIRGATPAATSAAVDFFISLYVKDSRVEVPEELYLTRSGLEGILSSGLPGEPLSDYAVTVPYDADRYLQYAAECLTEALREATGASVHTTYSMAAEGYTPPRELILQRTSRVGEPQSLCFNETVDDSAEVVRIVRGFIDEHLRDLPEGAVLDLDALSLSPHETAAAPTHPTLAGKMPVALTDQKNATVAVIDLAAADPTSPEALIWEWKPSPVNGFNVKGYETSVDEAKLRYDAKNDRHLVCVTSSAGFFGVATYPAGECVWSGYAKLGPHSIEWLPNGNVAVACSGNTHAENGVVRVYAASQGKTADTYAEVKLSSAHGLVWDDTLGVLWALGADVVCAYRIGGTDAAPTITELPSLRAKMPHGGGHDLQPDPTDSNILWVSGKNVLRFDKRTGKFSSLYPGVGTFSTASIKSFGMFPDGTAVRTVAANVFKAHDTDTLDWFVPDGTEKWQKRTAGFPTRAFYKARIWSANYDGGIR